MSGFQYNDALKEFELPFDNANIPFDRVHVYYELYLMFENDTYGKRKNVPFWPLYPTNTCQNEGPILYDIIDSDKPEKHSLIQRKIEGCLDDDKELDDFLKSRPKVNASFLDYSLPVLIQSGQKFTLNKFGHDSTDDLLNSNCIYLNVCTKFCDMTAMVSRTLLVNPKDDQQAGYKLALETLDTAIASLKVGAPIKDAYKAAKNFLAGRNSDLAARLYTNIGFGVSEN